MIKDDDRGWMGSLDTQVGALTLRGKSREGFQKKVCNMLEKVVNYIDGIAPSWEAGCDRIYNKLMNFLDGAEESTIKAIDKVQHSPLGKVIDARYKRNHPDED